ncbi:MULTISPECIES: hypothetical protein [unclassified Arcicella]|uniref:hypothetical protein n=1 Tax=unclassified Arcicella TaxID=2644986 RepID=UPI00285E5C16|nr:MULTISPECIES: hypothetical protein [unclassified Arcicella]MDR6561916.1 uncharacterized membrane protein YozB (DUF420 family) [Arcicella sp. BE51]MDR6811787.1 uncharacterized membrane protein YozB (DUF420 family) [Arcicella sp. BE140]MDR6822817.1 uncharacterized membrane protein YozB (DUF420 family) [Arcicella sp. BE139]
MHILLFIHSLLRWLVLISIIYAILRAYLGLKNQTTFSKTDNSVRHWTATIAHIQLVVGINLYIKSPTVKYFLSNFKQAIQHLEFTFFGLIHILLMSIAIIVLTIGSALAKRRKNDEVKYKTMLVWFSLALFIIFIAIPWPFSPLAHRPFFRQF